MRELTKRESAYLANIMKNNAWGKIPLNSLNEFMWCYSERLQTRLPQVWDECCELAKKLAGH